DSYLEYAFLRWVLAPSATAGLAPYVAPQAEVTVAGHAYRVDYEIVGDQNRFVVELDGFEHHGHRAAFTYDRLRQNDLHASGRIVIRFSYDAIRCDTRRCVEQLQALLYLDSKLAPFVIPNPIVEDPDMSSDPLVALEPSPMQRHQMSDNYFDE